MNVATCSAIAVAVLGLTLPGVVVAQDPPGPPCGKFTVYIENPTVEFFDVGDSGVSAGDRRIGRYDVVDVNGDRLGTFFFLSTIMPAAGEDKVPLLATGHYDIGTGSVVTTLHYDLDDASDTGSAAARRFVYPVTGGTGPFTGARGTITASLDDQGRRQHIFDLTCLD